MPPRRSHTKSRNGCAKCKKRRVKCDEVHPSCGNCIKHAVECDFSLVQAPNESNTYSPDSAPTLESSVIKASTPTFRSNAISILQPCNLDFSLVPLLAIPQRQQMVLHTAGPFRWTTQDMELMHHFILSAPKFLSANDSAEAAWRDAVPKIAFGDKHGFVIHAILAVSSLHLGYLELENRSIRLINATTHYDQSVRAISMMLPNICVDNCEALLISSALLMVFATASPMFFEQSSPENEPWMFPEWMPLLRGVSLILNETQHSMHKGCLSPIIVLHYTSQVPLCDDINNSLKDLYRLCTDASEPDPEEIKDAGISLSYREAIQRLEECFTNRPNPGGNLMSLIFIWPVIVSERYVTLLKDRRPRALIIFAYYCVLMKLGDLPWWLDGRAEYELVRIERSIQDLERWRQWLEWPKKMVGEILV